MAEAPAFDRVSDELEKRSRFDRLEARGTLRLALKAAGLTPGTVTLEQMAVVLEKILPGEIATRGLAGGDALCESIADRLGSVASAAPEDPPDAIFDRLGKR